MEQKSFNLIYGSKKIILSAPHSVIHKRIDSIRPSETRTGILVKTIAHKCNTYGIYKIKNEDNDANWDENCEYKKYLGELIKNEKIKALIDIHGMAHHRIQDICIGINGGKNIQNNYKILNIIIEIFNSYGFEKVTVDIPFSASYKNCVSNYIAKKYNIPSFQIEINLKYRSSKYPEYEKYKELYEALQKIVESLDKQL